ncbi:uncharacterized protein [Argopecten irradians]|uniref:uncharacterized protein n=1 Tax=Argopecten irradians TaxID=31199 RepID=UPI003715D186
MGQSSTKTKVKAVTAWGTGKASTKQFSLAANNTRKTHIPGPSEPQNNSNTAQDVEKRKAPNSENERSLTTTGAFIQNKNSKWSILRPSNTRVHADASLTAKFYKSFPFTTPSDADTDGFKHNRVVALADDTIIVLDRNNDKLKLFSSDYRFLHHVGTPSGGPLGIDYANGLTVVDKRTVAVSFGGLYNFVNVYSVEGGKIELTTTAKRRDKSGDLLDITYLNKAFVCLVSHYSEYIRSIELMDTDNHRRVIVKEKGLFSVYTDIVAGERNCFYVSYTFPHKIRCFSFEGSQLWNIPAPTGAAGLTLAQGQVCIVLENGILRRVSTSGQGCSDHDLGLPFTPHCLCFQRQAQRFVMTYCPLYGRIRVFELC